MVLFAKVGVVMVVRWRACRFEVKPVVPGCIIASFVVGVRAVVPTVLFWSVGCRDGVGKFEVIGLSSFLTPLKVFLLKATEWEAAPSLIM